MPQPVNAFSEVKDRADILVVSLDLGPSVDMHPAQVRERRERAP